MSPKGNHTVAIIRGSENYKELEEALCDLYNEVARLTSITVDGFTFPIEYFLCSDLKFLAIICGIESANSTYACIWCTCPASERHEMDKTWSFEDVAHGARTNESILSCLSQPKAKRLGCKNAPLFPTVPIHRVIPDVLHLFLRITDVLFDLLILGIRRQDALSGSDSLTQLETFVQNDCRISSFKFHASKEKKNEIQWRDLVGPEKLVLFAKINIETMFPDVPKSAAIQQLWTDFKKLYKLLQSEKVSSETASKFGKDAKQWVIDFKQVYQSKNVTPYIHILAQHVPEFLKKYGNLVQFTQQGMEKLNDKTTVYFARSTNHNYHNLDALKQLLLKKNRLEHLEDSGHDRQPLAHKCSVCHEIGHNKLRCNKSP